MKIKNIQISFNLAAALNRLKERVATGIAGLSLIGIGMGIGDVMNHHDIVNAVATLVASSCGCLVAFVLHGIQAHHVGDHGDDDESD